MYDLAAPSANPAYDISALSSVSESRRGFFAVKRGFDVVVSLFLFPILLVCAIGLTLLNPFYNRGPLFFMQTRMGRHCKPFRALKFRSMRESREVERAADGPLEHERITPLGRFIRKMRIDELPQVLNVLRGEMSLIGPRPDYFSHAKRYMREIPGYRERHLVRPGISGLAQTELGYAEGLEATRKKVDADLYYIANTDLRLEAWIFWRTLAVVARRAGA